MESLVLEMKWTEENEKAYKECKAVQSLAVYFGDLRNYIENTRLEELKSFKKAKSTFFKIFNAKAHGDFSFHAEILKAFENCYVDVEEYEKAAEMKKRRDQLCEKHNLKLDP